MLLKEQTQLVSVNSPIAVAVVFTPFRVDVNFGRPSALIGVQNSTTKLNQSHELIELKITCYGHVGGKNNTLSKI